MVSDRIWKNARKYYKHTEFVVLDEIFRNFYASYSRDFKIHLKDKPGNYGLLFCALANTQYIYASRVLRHPTSPYVILPINNPEKNENIHDLVMQISNDILNNGRNAVLPLRPKCPRILQNH